jgi:hypothetical protein
VTVALVKFVAPLLKAAEGWFRLPHRHFLPWVTRFFRGRGCAFVLQNLTRRPSSTEEHWIVAPKILVQFQGLAH